MACVFSNVNSFICFISFLDDCFSLALYIIRMGTYFSCKRFSPGDKNINIISIYIISIILFVYLVLFWHCKQSNFRALRIKLRDCTTDENYLSLMASFSKAGIYLHIDLFSLQFASIETLHTVCQSFLRLD